jgi:hypothetical protein
VALSTHPSKAEVKERVELYLYSFWTFVACSMVNLTSTTEVVYVVSGRNRKKKENRNQDNKCLDRDSIA